MATTPMPTLLQPIAAESNNPPAPQASEVATPGRAQTAGHALRRILSGTGSVLLLAGIAGGIHWLRRPRHTVETGLSPATAGDSSGPGSKCCSAPQVITDLPLDPLVVNLADEGGHSYARLGLTLQIANPSARAGSESADAAGAATDMRDTLRDQIISVLHLQQSTGLLAPNGKDHLKQAIERPSPLRT